MIILLVGHTYDKHSWFVIGVRFPGMLQVQKKQNMKSFKSHKVDVRGLSRKEAKEKRKIEYRRWQLSQQLKEVIAVEQNKNERNAWKVRSYLANKERN